MKKKIMSLVLAGVIAAGSVVSVCADDAAPAKGIKFKADSGIKANLYTGYVVGLETGVTAGNVLDALENRVGIEIVRDGAVADADAVNSGDKLVLKNADGSVKTSLDMIFMGDANADSATNVSDVTATLKKIAKWNIIIDEVAADVSGDGGISVTDVTLMLKKIAKWNVDFVKEPVLPGAGNISTNHFVNGYSAYNNNEKFSKPMPLMPGDEIGMKFSVPEGKFAKNINVMTHSLADNKGEMRFSLFLWQGDYANTVAYDPIYTTKFVDYTDNTELVLNTCDSAQKGIGAGEYLLVIHEGFDTDVDENGNSKPNGVGVWGAVRPLDETGVMTYYQGVAMESTVSYAFGILATISMGN